MIIRSLTLILLALILTSCLGVAPQEASTPTITTRTVEIRGRDRPLVSTPGSEPVLARVHYHSAGTCD